MQKVLNKPVIKIGRIAGQYAKPRSNPTEIVDGTEISSFFGDNVNSFEPEAKLRKPDPYRLLEGYNLSALTYQTIRRLEKKDNIEDIIKEVQDSKFEDQPDLDSDAEDYEEFVKTLKDCIPTNSKIDALYTSHEGLLLDYETCLTRAGEEADVAKAYYNMSAHYLWIGERTNKLGEAHLEYFRGISNPIGVK